MRRATRVFLALLLACATACSDDGTSLFLRVEGADGATQLELRGVRDGAPWFGPERRPEPEGAPFSGEQTLRVRFNSPPDVPFLLEVDALAGGVAIARASTEVLPRKGEETELRLQLSPIEDPGPGPDGGTPDAGGPDGGAPDGGEPDAGEPDAGTDAGTPDAGGGCTTCVLPGGGCVATTSAVACGGSGLACVDCTVGGRANVCTAAGACSCGTRGTPCGEGERCDGNVCVCDPDTCAGCCDSNGSDCRTGNTLTACGINGATCTECSAQRADNCATGGCRCGTGPACSGLAPNCRNGSCSAF
ncbi:hypothetical protein HPC49_50070 [Pyxidicoccus fallax]|uniref:Lipoprotein n=1 Tax=Pyxidicoccus fallax TaxID=394095 RepID=A0A848M1Q0_9BACT|nr:hypothetical protein [Pyxidicoccus fallax]NMO23284.1 hypothetical protein [Pyxidicoccus fallax]NPC86321.1 hypothetical protein [Pyxidicoccus fallax]